MLAISTLILSKFVTKSKSPPINDQTVYMHQRHNENSKFESSMTDLLMRYFAMCYVYDTRAVPATMSSYCQFSLIALYTFFLFSAVLQMEFILQNRLIYAYMAPKKAFGLASAATLHKKIFYFYSILFYNKSF